ncbi:MAG: class I SAM-dependent methyltransferase [bacterium]|nr:class I SAM-dependent methyltransferase [bacterium]
MNGDKNNNWKVYNEWAWIESVLSSHEDYAAGTEVIVKIVKENPTTGGNALLHLACGAGGNDFTFKKNFKVTGVDISPGMLDIARKLNPEAVYHLGDMRTVQLNQTFDVVAIPDSIGYMTTAEDLKQVIDNAAKHLKPGGLVIVTAHSREEFKENNFVYTGSDGETLVTVFENNYIRETDPSTYEATVVCLIRRKGKLETYNETHVIGLFKRETWLELLRAGGFEVQQARADDFYDNYLMAEGEYKQTIFIGTLTPA